MDDVHVRTSIASSSLELPWLMFNYLGCLWSRGRLGGQKTRKLRSDPFRKFRYLLRPDFHEDVPAHRHPLQRLTWRRTSQRSLEVGPDSVPCLAWQVRFLEVSALFPYVFRVSMRFFFEAMNRFL